ncbi:MAG: hypothetical protein ACJ8H8_32105, partial [Geminicoccaceae bacterium]
SRTATDFSVQLVRPNGSLSAKVALSSYLALRGPVGRSDSDSFAELHPILMTARVPLEDFGLSPADAIRGVRFSFDRSRSGAIQLADVRLSKCILARSPAPVVAAATDAPLSTAAEAPAPSTRAASGRTVPTARIVAVRPAAGAPATRTASAAAPVEIEIAADQPLPVTDSLPVLTIGDQQIRQSRYAVAGRTDRIVFTLGVDQFARLPDGAQAELQVGGARRMPLGRLQK